MPSVASVPRADERLDACWGPRCSTRTSRPSSPRPDRRRPSAAHRLRIVVTPLHGVGGAVAERVLREAGFTDVNVVPEQAEPDPDFPTVAFPNPEEPGAIDLALGLAQRRRRGPGHRERPGRRPLRRRRPRPAARLLPRARTRRRPRAGACCTATRSGRCSARRSSRGAATERAARWPARSCRRGCSAGSRAAARARHASTLTGLQVDLPRRRPRVRLRGGARLLRRPRARARQGRHLRGGAASRSSPTGSRRRAARSSTRSTTSPARTACTSPARCRRGSRTSRGSRRRCRGSAAAPPTTPGGLARRRGPSTSPTGLDGLPPTDGVLCSPQDGTRVIVRPSGTEPKVKCYIEVVLPSPGGERARGGRGAHRRDGRAARRRSGRTSRTALGI